MESSTLDQVQKWYHRGEFGRVVRTCTELLQNPANSPIRAEILYWKGLGHLGAGYAWHGEAISCFREGMAGAGKNRALKAKHMVALGHVYNITSDCASFDRMMKDFPQLMRDRNPEVMRSCAALLFNYGVTLDNAFRWTEAAQELSMAVELAREFGSSQLGKYLHNLGGVWLSLGQLSLAAEAMAQAEDLLPDAWNGHKTLSRKAEYFLAVGDLVSAQQKITAALVHPMVDDMTRADVYYTWAQALLSLGRPDEAQEKALLGLDLAVKAVHYAGIHKINRFLDQFNSQRRP